MVKSGTKEESTEPTSAPKSPNAIPVYRVGIPFFGSTRQFRQSPFQFHLEGYHRHGPIYRTRIDGKNWIVLSGLEANDLIWRNTDLWSYREANAAFAEQLGTGHVTQLDGDPHKKRRQQLKPGFKMEAVMRYLPQMDQAAAELLPAMCDRPINITDAFAELILLITSRTTFRCSLPPEMVTTMSHWEHDFISTALSSGGSGGPFGGAVTGYVARWDPGKGEREIMNTRIRYPNGVVVSADGRFMYLNEFSAGQVYKYDLKNEKVLGSVKVDFLPDNLTWTKEGRLLAAGVKGARGDCPAGSGRPCIQGFGVAEIDPAKMQARAIFDSAAHDPLIGGVSVALEVGDSIYLGAFQGTAW